ncbi:MAG: di-trans,poly-cis-decaprenylcistransferase [Myxococcales bacterium]|nr:di-trans,poly-cis-decaprenylcistransferase [Myxococcales bacterium]
MPRHVAIIMDGNGRWAELRSRPRWEGHAAGAQSVRAIVTAARENGVEALTLYAFSVQNWGRPQSEVEHLMTLLLDYLVEERATIVDNGIRLRGIGQIDRLPPKVREQLDFLERSSEHLGDMILTLALSYGGREEIIEVCRRIAEDAAKGRLSSDDVDEATVEGYMYTRDLPPLDLLIRTSGEMRLSNFLLWQAAYAEIVVVDTLWPDFRERELFDCIETFRARQRRYGKTGAQVAGLDGPAG